MRCWARSVSLCSIYFICQKSSRFLLIFFSVIDFEDIVIVEIMKWKVGVTVLIQEKRSIYLAIKLSLREISYISLTFCAKIVCSRDVQYQWITLSCFALCLLLMVNSRILGLISQGTAHFVVNGITIFLLQWRVATAIEVWVAKRGWPTFWRKIKSLKTQNVQIFLFVNLIL